MKKSRISNYTVQRVLPTGMILHNQLGFDVASCDAACMPGRKGCPLPIAKENFSIAVLNPIADLFVAGNKICRQVSSLTKNIYEKVFITSEFLSEIPKCIENALCAVFGFRVKIIDNTQGNRSRHGGKRVDALLFSIVEDNKLILAYTADVIPLLVGDGDVQRDQVGLDSDDSILRTRHDNEDCG